MQHIQFNNINFQTEWHLHIDCFNTEPNYLENAIPEFFQNGGKIHNFDHYIRDNPNISEFHGNEPIEHVSQYWRGEVNFETLLKAQTDIWLNILKTKGFKGYLEYELVQAVDTNDRKMVNYDDIKKLPAFDTHRTKKILNVQNLFFEVHFTVPLRFIHNNRHIFRQLSLRGVSLKKRDGQRYAVLTALYDNIDTACMTFEYLYSLQTGFALKIEQKYFVLPYPDQVLEVGVVEVC